MRRKGLFMLVIGMMAIGFASLGTTLYINGTASVKANVADFKVFFTNATLDGVDISSTAISTDKQTITFTTKELSVLNDYSTLVYTIENQSTQYDADVTLVCVQDENKYLTISNTPGTMTLGTEDLNKSDTGTLTATLTKSFLDSDSDELDVDIKCTINASAVEK